MRAELTMQSVKNMAWAILSPPKLFLNIKQKRNGFFCIFFITAVLILLQLGIRTEIRQLMHRFLPGDTLNEIFSRPFLGPFPVAITLTAMFLCQLFVITAVIWLLARLFIQPVAFKKLGALVACSSVILLFQQLIYWVVFSIKSGYADLHAQDLAVYLGLELFFKNMAQPVFLRAFLAGFNVVTVWWLTVMITGLTVVFKIIKIQAAVLAFSAWSFWIWFHFLGTDLLNTFLI